MNEETFLEGLFLLWDFRQLEMHLVVVLTLPELLLLLLLLAHLNLYQVAMLLFFAVVCIECFVGRLWLSARFIRVLMGFSKVKLMGLMLLVCLSEFEKLSIVPPFIVNSHLVESFFVLLAHLRPFMAHVLHDVAGRPLFVELLQLLAVFLAKEYIGRKGLLGPSYLSLSSHIRTDWFVVRGRGFLIEWDGNVLHLWTTRSAHFFFLVYL